MSRPDTLPGIPGGVGLRVAEYVEFLSKEYLGGFVRAGGAAVRLVVTGDDDVAARWHAGIAEAASTNGYVTVSADAEATRVHLVQELFFTASAQVDWRAAARTALRAAYDRLGLAVPDISDLDVASVAAMHDVDHRELLRSLRRALEASILGDTSLAHEFRVAMLRLCQAEAAAGDVDDDERDAVLGWLRGESVPLARLRSASIHTRIGRHNARVMLLSTASWLARSGWSGLVLDLDLVRLAVARRPPLEQRDGVYYSKAAVLDAYELLRQLIDATDAARYLLVVVALPPDLVNDESRGLPAYAALQLRVADEVRDRRRTNPFAALVRLETRVEAVR